MKSVIVQQIEEEINTLTLAEDQDLEKHYNISDDIQNEDENISENIDKSNNLTSQKQDI